jgi:hypothetical protein
MRATAAIKASNFDRRNRAKMQSQPMNLNQ